MNDKSDQHQKILEHIKNFRLLDDDFMTKCFEDNIEATEFILKIILNLDLKVKSVKTQDTIKNLYGRSVRLDIHAVSAEGKHFNIEIQRQDKGAGATRARFNASILDSNILLSGEDFDELPEVYIIFITEKDVLQLNEPIYFIERSIIGKDKLFNDGSHIVYVNNEIQDDTPLGKLMHDFVCTNAEDMNYEILAERVRYFKEDKEGVITMCKAIEDLMKELLEENRRETILEEHRKMAIKLINNGDFPFEKIAELCELTIEEVEELANKKSA